MGRSAIWKINFRNGLRFDGEIVKGDVLSFVCSGFILIPKFKEY